MERGMVGMLRRSDQRAPGGAGRALAEIRALRQKHPVMDMAAGLIPGVGVGQGIDDLTNSELPVWQRALGGASALPGGALLKALRARPGAVQSMVSHVKDPLEETMELKLPAPEDFKVDPSLEATQEIVLGEAPQTLHQKLAKKSVLEEELLKLLEQGK